jgi:AbrB family looped-hinge helix DNA binding protein
MKFSTITQKGRVTIPLEIRKKLGLRAGNKIRFEVKGDCVIFRKVCFTQSKYFLALSTALCEWSSKEDDEAYRDL